MRAAGLSFGIGVALGCDRGRGVCLSGTDSNPALYVGRGFSRAGRSAFVAGLELGSGGSPARLPAFFQAGAGGHTINRRFTSCVPVLAVANREVNAGSKTRADSTIGVGRPASFNSGRTRFDGGGVRLRCRGRRPGVHLPVGIDGSVLPDRQTMAADAERHVER